MDQPKKESALNRFRAGASLADLAGEAGRTERQQVFTLIIDAQIELTEYMHNAHCDELERVRQEERKAAKVQ